jgi:hypothetical protein
MSYTKTVSVGLTENTLGFLQIACEELGLDWLGGMDKYVTHEGLRDCVHAIRIEGGTHTIGVVRSLDDPNTFDLSADFYQNARLRDTVGENFEILRQRVSTNGAKFQLYQRGARDIRETVEDDNRVRLVASMPE